MRFLLILLVQSATLILASPIPVPIPDIQENINNLITFSDAYISPTAEWEDITPPTTQNWPVPPTTELIVASDPKVFCQTFNVLIGTLELLKSFKLKETQKQLDLLFDGMDTAADDFMVEESTAADGRAKHTTRCEEYVKEGGKPMMEALAKLVRKYFGVLFVTIKGDTAVGSFGLFKLSDVVGSGALVFLRTLYSVVKGEVPANEW